MRFRPCIDLRGGRVVQIVGGTLRGGIGNGDKGEGEGEVVTNFESERSAGEYARIYKKDGLFGGHVISLGEGNEEAVMEALSAWPGGMQMGGGVDVDNAGRYLNAGASHVIVTSYVFKDGRIDMERLREMVSAVGKKRLVLDLSCRKRSGDVNDEGRGDGGKYWVVTDRWRKFTDVAVCGETLGELAEYCDEFLVHGVDVEGKMAGIEEELVWLLGEMSPIAVTYAGGARELGDLDRVKRIGGGRVDLTIGSGLDIFGGHIRYADVVKWQRGEDECGKV